MAITVRRDNDQEGKQRAAHFLCLMWLLKISECDIIPWQCDDGRQYNVMKGSNSKPSRRIRRRRYNYWVGCLSHAKRREFNLIGKLYLISVASRPLIE